MASPDATRPDGTLVANQYQVDRNRQLPLVSGLAAFGVIDHLTARTDLMAIQLSRQWPPRSRALQALTTPIEGLLTPIAYGPVGSACYTICPTPPGVSVKSRSRPWPEMELLECVLRPAAHVLEHLQGRGITHRGIRLDNVFQSAPGQPVVLGPAWETPPAMAQPALFEPPFRRCACQPGAATAASPMTCMRWACCCYVWRSGVRRLRSWMIRHFCAASLSSGHTLRWPAMTACRRSSAIWCGACWRRTPSIGRHRRCYSIRRARVGVGLPLGRHGGRSGPSSWRATRFGMPGRWPTRLQTSPRPA